MKQLLFSCMATAMLFFTTPSNSQVLKWRITEVSKVISNKSDRPTPLLTDSCNFLLVYNLDKQQISIHTSDSVYHYDCVGYHIIESKKTQTTTLIKSVDDSGIDCKLNLRTGDNVFKDYDGELQIIYSGGTRIYFLKDL